jgi:hypothetical protein
LITVVGELVSTFISESGWLINNRLAEIQISSSQLIRIETNMTAPPISSTFLRPIRLLSDNSRLQIDLESLFVIKPAPRTDKEVLIKSAAVTRRIIIPIKNTK